MDSLSTAIDHVSTSPATQDPRNLANVPPEILQLVFKLVFEKAAVFCTCNPPLCLRHHATEGSWGMLLTCRRFYQEGLEIWHEAVVLHTAYLLLDHLPKHMVEHCKHVRLTSLFIEGLPTYSLEVEREAISKFQHLEMLELPRLEPFEYAKPGRIPDDQEVLQLYNDSEAAYAEWAKEIIECSPKLTVKFWKDLYINNIIDMYLICDIVIKKDKTMANKTLKRYLWDEDKNEELECLDECKELLAKLGIDTSHITWG